MGESNISWFFAFNDNYPGVYELVERAVRSSLPFAIDRYCVCDTNHEGVIAFLESHGVRIIRTRVSFDEALEQSDVVPPGEKDIWRGTGLRLDIPRLIDRLSLPVGDYYLYTDTDVFFLNDPVAGLTALAPDYFAASGEFTRDPNPPYYNAGVLWANCHKMRETCSDLIEFLVAHRCRVPSRRGHFDQGLLNEFYLGKIDYLGCEFNWKPYWGFNENAFIVHWHGPKPGDVLARRQGTLMVPIYETLYATRPDTPETYQRYLDLYDRFGDHQGPGPGVPTG